MAPRKKATRAKTKSRVKKKAAKKTVRKTVKKAVKKAVRKIAKKAVKKTAAKKSVTTKPLGRVSDPYTKTMLVTTISERTGLSKAEVGSVFGELAGIIEGHLKKSGPGVFTMPKMFKMTVRKTPARKARKGINPFTGEPTIFKAKPASKKVKITPLKDVKEMPLG